jgi:type IV pilus assembly protein PilW
MKQPNPYAVNSSKGFSLVELMISITLGLLIVAATLSIFASNKQAYRTTENLGRVQESARMSFELIGNDVREASGTQCSRGIDVVSVLTPSAPMAGGDFWSDWVNSVRGIENTGPNNSDTLQLKSAGEDMFHVNNHNSATATANINSSQNHDLLAGDVVMLCDYRQGAIFQVAAVAGDDLTHTAGGLNTIANLGIGGAAYTFDDHATISRINATQWFIAANGRGGNSLFRSTLRNVGGNPAMVQEEIAEGVNNMQVSFLLPGNADFVTSAAVPVARWDEVLAVRIAITFESADAIGTGAVRIQRPMIQTFNLRNRML